MQKKRIDHKRCFPSPSTCYHARSYPVWLAADLLPPFRAVWMKPNHCEGHRHWSIHNKCGHLCFPLPVQKMFWSVRIAYYSTYSNDDKQKQRFLLQKAHPPSPKNQWTILSLPAPMWAQSQSALRYPRGRRHLQPGEPTWSQWLTRSSSHPANPASQTIAIWNTFLATLGQC